MNTPKGSHDRLLALRAPSRIDQRPSTPAVWSNDLAVNGSILAPPKIIETDNQASLEETDYQNDNDEDEDYDDDDEHDNADDNVEDGDDEDVDIDDEDDDDEDTTSQSNKSQSSWDNNAPEAFHPENNLGGWGAPVNDNWATPSTSTSLSTKYSNPVSLKEVQEEQQQQQQNQQQNQPQQQFTSQQWACYTADAYKDDWKQSPLEYSTTHYKKNTTSGHYRNAPMVTESEGWGQPNNVIPWDDMKQQGFVKEKLEEQASTTYWSKTNGQWVGLSPAATAAAAANTSTTTTTTTTIRKKGNIKYSNGSASKKNKPTSTQYGRRSSSSSSDDQLNLASPTPVTFASLNASHTKSKSRQRSSSVVSSDNSVDWDADDSDVVIKVHQDFPPLQKPNTGKNREAPITNWNSAAEWDGKLFLI